MKVTDFNGCGRWSAVEIMARYHAHASTFGVRPRDVWPSVHKSGDRAWVYPVMDRVIEGIEAGDPACAQIGVEFIEEDRGFPFGAILKSNTARALRRCGVLTDEQVDRIRRRVTGLYATGIVPREFTQYLKLLRSVGIGSCWPVVAAARPGNYFARRAKAYFESWFVRDGRPAPN